MCIILHSFFHKKKYKHVFHKTVKFKQPPLQQFKNIFKKFTTALIICKSGPSNIANSNFGTIIFCSYCMMVQTNFGSSEPCIQLWLKLWFNFDTIVFWYKRALIPTNFGTIIFWYKRTLVP